MHYLFAVTLVTRLSIIKTCHYGNKDSDIDLRSSLTNLTCTSESSLSLGS